MVISYIPAPSTGWCLNPKGLLNGTPTHIHLAPLGGSRSFQLQSNPSHSVQALRKEAVYQQDIERFLVGIPSLNLYLPLASLVGIQSIHYRRRFNFKRLLIHHFLATRGRKFEVEPLTCVVFFLGGLRTAFKKLLCRKSPGKSVIKSFCFIYNESQTLNGTGLFTYIWGSLEGTCGGFPY